MWLLHGTSERDWHEIQRSGGLRNPYLTRHETVAWYFAEEAAAVGEGNAPILLRVEVPDTEHLEADIPMLQEPIMEVVEELGYRNVFEYHRAVRNGLAQMPQDRQDWKTSLDVMGCVRYYGAIPLEHVTVYGRSA